MGYKKIKRMTTFMRINHWIVAFSMLGAIITGFYIGHPYYSSFISEHQLQNGLWHGIDGGIL